MLRGEGCAASDEAMWARVTPARRTEAAAIPGRGTGDQFAVPALGKWQERSDFYSENWRHLSMGTSTGEIRHRALTGEEVVPLF